MTIQDLVAMFKGFKKEHDIRISIWFGEEDTGDWFGTFPINHVPNEYKTKDVSEWCFYGAKDKYSCDVISVVIEQ